MDIINATGRRKKAIARVYIQKGKGKIIVNNRDFKEYFPLKELQQKINQPFEYTDSVNQFDLHINVQGGGFTGQTEAIRLGIARALCKIDENYHAALKEHSLLTRDPRVIERKKYGRPKARKRFQFSKR